MLVPQYGGYNGEAHTESGQQIAAARCKWMAQHFKSEDEKDGSYDVTDLKNICAYKSHDAGLLNNYEL